MTCEVAVMNKHGIALAADSAVTLGAGEKIYHGAEKLFALSPSMPIGVMTYGNANLMGAPWEIVIKSYGRQLGGQKFERVEQCVLSSHVAGEEISRHRRMVLVRPICAAAGNDRSW